MSPEEIRARRLALGWSQAQLATAAGTKQQNIDRLERGVVRHARALPAIEAALRRAELPAGSLVFAASDETPVVPPGVQVEPVETGQLDLWTLKHDAAATTTNAAPDLWRGLRPVYAVVARDGERQASATPCDLAAPPPFLLPVVEAFGLLLEAETDAYGAGDLIWVNPRLPARPDGPGVWLSGPLETGPQVQLSAGVSLHSAKQPLERLRVVAIYFRR